MSKNKYFWMLRLFIISIVSVGLQEKFAKFIELYIIQKNREPLEWYLL